jgi:acyl transferase domain-containing protein
MTVNGHTNGAGGGYHDDDIAIIGLDLKFPGDAATPEEFYKLLLDGRSALSDISKDRYNIDAFYHPDPERAGAVGLLSGRSKHEANC